MGIIVCDNGTGFVKVGWATSNAPDHVFPSIVGKPLLRSDTTGNLSTASTVKAHNAVAMKLLAGDWVVGEDAERFRDALDIHHPMENGVVRSWPEMEAIWEHAFGLLGVPNGHGHSILLTEPPLNPKQNRARMVRLMFEKYGFDAVHVAVQAILVLYSQGLTSGVVLDAGDGVTHIVPVFEGIIPEHLVKRVDLAGRDVTRQLIKLLQMSGYQFNRTSDFQQVQIMKEQVCYAAPVYERECRLAEETTHVNADFTLPDGRTVIVREERFKAPEILFQPHHADKEFPGIAHTLFDTINGAALDTRSALYKHIVLSGGTTTIPGFKDRLEADLKSIYVDKILNGDRSHPNKQKIKVYDPENRKHAVFTGGAVLAELMHTSPSFWITKQEWQTHGEACLSKWKM